MSYSTVVGDLERPMTLTLNTDLTTADDYSLTWMKPDGTVVTGVELTAVDESVGLVQRVWSAGDTDMAGVHRGRVVVDWPVGGRPQTYPNDGTWFIWYVYE